MLVKVAGAATITGTIDEGGKGYRGGQVVPKESDGTAWQGESHSGAVSAKGKAANRGVSDLFF
jgi:hypothetical protein